MLLHAKNAVVAVADGEMDYIRFGTGEKTLIMLPGLGDGLKTVKGTAFPLAVMYRGFAKTHTVYVFSRRRQLPEGYTTRDMARDQKVAMDVLGIPKADVLGVSMGGMIAQHLAADYPEKVGKLVLVVTSARANPILTDAVTEWMELAKRGDHTALMDSNVKRMYSMEYYRKNKWLIPVVGRLSKPKSYERFFLQGQACLTHDAYCALQQIRTDTLVIGGEKDAALGGEASREIYRQIPGAKLKMYEKWGHALYEEAKDFSKTVLDFLEDKE